MPSIRTTLFAPGTIVAAWHAAALAAPAPAASAPPLTIVSTAPPSQPVEFDIMLPLTNAAGLDTLVAQQQDPGSPNYHKWLKPASFASRFGPNPQLVQVVSAALQSFGLHVTAQSRSVHVSGTIGEVNAAFKATLATAADALGRQHLVASNGLVVPPALSNAGAVISAFTGGGFEAAPMVRRSGSGYVHNSSNGYGSPASSSSPSGGYFYNDLKQAYDFPSYQSSAAVGHGQRLDGTGSTVAVVMASDVLDTDVAALFDHENFRANSGAATDPAISARRMVNGGAAFSATNPASEEATLDVEQVLGGAPGANVILYDTPDLTDQSLISAYVAIVNDNTADVVSLSFGQCELYYTAAYNGGQDQTAILRLYSELFEQGNAQGITFVAASGDAGGLGCLNPGYFSGSSGQFIPGVSVPAADPDVTAVGGTNLVTAAEAGGSGSGYARENAWSDPEIAFDPFGLGVNASGGVWGAGGGVSTLYAKPTYQSLVSTASSSFRTVPDVGLQVGGCPDIASSPCNGGDVTNDGSGNAERSTLNVVFNGLWDGVVGTSAAAPEMAGAVALMVETQGRQGNLNPYLYALAQRQAAGGATYFHQSVPGFNGMTANAGTYNETTGNGTPDVSAMIGLASLPAAGLPQSASNP